MISILSSFKPFRGSAAILQENSLRNWRRLGKSVEIILYGDGEGIAEKAAKYGARHVPEILCSDHGVPRFDNIVDHARKHAEYDQQIYLNGDILLPPDTISRLQNINLDRYLAVGQKINLTANALFDPLAQKWTEELRRCVDGGMAEYADATWIDYFVFRRGEWLGLKPLVIGRGRYDCALIAYCLLNHVPIIDATWDLQALHQYHDYKHIGGGYMTTRYGPDGVANMNHHDVWHSPPDIREAQFRLKNGAIITNEKPDILRKIEMLLKYQCRQKYLSYGMRALTRIAWKFGMCQQQYADLKSVLSSK